MKENKQIIPFHKPYPFSRTDEEQIFLRLRGVFRTGMLSNKYYCRQLEEEIKQLYDVKHVISCSSCTQGIFIVLYFLRKRNHVLVLPSFEWESIKKIIKPFRFMIDYKDINEKTWLIDTDHSFGGVQLRCHTFGNID